MGTFYKRNFETNKIEPTIILSKSDEIDFHKEHHIPGTVDGKATLITSSYSGKMFPSYRINHIFSNKDNNNVDENYKLWPLVVHNSVNNEKYSYYMINDFSKMGQVPWNNYSPPINWDAFVNYMNVNGLWGEKNPHSVGINKYRADCFSAQLSTGWSNDCWNGGGQTTQHYGDGTLLLTQFKQYEGSTAFSETSSFKTKLLGESLPLGNVSLRTGYSKPLTYQEVYFDLPNLNTKSITLGFEGILSGDYLDVDINTCKRNFYDSLFILGLKGGWCNQESQSDNDGFAPSTSYVKSKVYSLLDGNQFSIIKKKIAPNLWYFCDKNMIKLNGADRAVQHYRGEDANITEINYSSADGGHGANLIVAFKNTTRSMRTLTDKIYGWYCGPTAAGDITWLAPDEWDVTKAHLWNQDFRKYFIFGEQPSWVYLDDIYSGSDSAEKYKHSDGYVHISHWGSDSMGLTRQDVVWSKITAHFSVAPVTSTYGQPSFYDTYGTVGVYYDKQTNVQLYREEDIRPARDYIEYKDACLWQPMYIIKTQDSNTHSWEIGAPYNLSAIATSKNGTSYYYCGSKETFQNTDDNWTTDLNDATYFLGNNDTDYDYLQNISGIILTPGRTEWPNSCGFPIVYRDGYKISPIIFTFPAHEANWVSMNYFFKQDP